MTSKTTSPTPNQPGRWAITKFGPPSVLQWQPIHIPTTLPPRRALIRILAAGVAGPDNIQRAGGYPNAKCQEPGFTPGYDFVGEIILLGDDCSPFKKGDRVAAMCMIGAHATHIELGIQELLLVGKGDDVVSVCALPLNYMTAYGMLRRSGVKLSQGSSIFVGSAAGGIGTAIAQLVQAFDMGINMIGSCSPSKFEYVRSLGMTPVDRTQSDIWKAVRGLTPNDEGVDVAYDAVGSPESLDQSSKSTKDGTGIVIAIGIMGDIASDGSGMSSSSSADQLLGQRLGPRMSYWGVERQYYQETNELWRRDFYEILEKVRSGALKPKISQLLPLRDAIRAHEMLVSGSNVKGKMMFIVDAALAEQLGV